MPSMRLKVILRAHDFGVIECIEHAPKRACIVPHVVIRDNHFAMLRTPQSREYATHFAVLSLDVVVRRNMDCKS